MGELPFESVVAGNKSRKNPRAVVSLVARYRSPTAFEFVAEECVDLSSGGMFIKSKAPAPNGTLLKLECDVDHGQGMLRAVARVVWVREREGHDEPRGMGVKFVKLEPGGRELITQLLERVGGNEGAGPAARVSSMPPPRGSMASSPISLAPALIAQQARVEPTAALPTALIEARPPQPISDHPVPPSKAPGPMTYKAATVEAAKLAPPPAPKNSQAPRPSAKAKAKAQSKAEPQHARRSSAAPRSDVPTHRPPPQRELDKRAVGLGAGLLAVVAIAVLIARKPAAPARETLSAEPAAQPVAEVTAAPSASFVLNLSTMPSGARIVVGNKSGTSPVTLELGELGEPIEVRAEMDGYEPVTSSIELDRFSESAGKRVAMVTLALRPLPREAVAPQANVSTAPVQAPAEPAAAPAPEPTASAREPRASRTARRSTTPPQPKASAPEAPTPPAAASEPVAATPTPAPAATPAPAPASLAPPATASAPMIPAGPLTAMQAARACLARNDPNCAVAALEGRARTAQEIELLAETYRGMGRTADLERYMKLYVERFPTERRAAAYSKQLGLPEPQ